MVGRFEMFLSDESTQPLTTLDVIFFSSDQLGELI